MEVEAERHLLLELSMDANPKYLLNSTCSARFVHIIPWRFKNTIAI